MLLNDEKYKLIDIDSLDFSVRLRNVAHRNGIRTLYDLVESYNSGEFEKMRNVGANTVQELLDFYLVSAEPSVEEVIPEVEKINYDDILPVEFLESSIDKYVYDIALYNHFKRHEVLKIRDILSLVAVDMLSWQQFGKVKLDMVLEFQRRSNKGDICYFINGEVKKTDEIEPSREIDAQVLVTLKNEYGFKYTWICDWFGVTRQWVDQKIKKAGQTHSGKWDGFSYTEEEAVVVLEMLKNKQTTYRDNDDFYYFLKSATGKVAIVLVNAECIRCFFDEDLTGELKEYIFSNRLNELEFRELEISANGSEVSILRTVYFVPLKEDVCEFSSYAKKHGMSREDYAVFLTGKPYANDFTITDVEIRNFFDEHLNEDGKVYISSDPSNQWIKSYACRKGYGIADFIAFYGYQSALAGDGLTAEGARKRHLERIKDFIVRDNIVYIPTYTDFYRVLNSYSAKRGISISEYVEELGYERTLTPGEIKGSDDDIVVFDAEEKDMEVVECGDTFIEKVFANNPLLGNYIFSEQNLTKLHNKAKKIIDTLVSTIGYKLSKEQKMTVALSVINYAKNWDTGLGTFTNFITKQYGYRSEDRVYPKIMTATYDAIVDNNRWAFALHGSIQYKSTVMIHAMGSIRSWMHLCDFLSDFYQNNLGCHYVEDDPYVLSMVMFMRRIFYASKALGEDENYEEFTVGSKPYRFQEGIRKLVVYRPNYAAKVFDRMLKRIHGYMNSDVHPVKKYEDSLVDLWFKNKTEYYFKFKRNIERTGTTGSHRIAFDYSHIRLDYRFYDNNVWIDVPDIRLTSKSSDVCYFAVFDGENEIENRSLKCYGNELGRTIAGFSYSLKVYLSIKETGDVCPRVIIKCGDDVIYDSLMKLKRRMLVFAEEREKELSSVEVGGYVVLASSEVDISGVEVETSIIKTVEDYKYVFVDLHDDYSLVVDDIIVSFDRKKAEKIRVNLPHYVRGVKYVEEGLDYSICKSNGEISIAVDENDVERKYIILLNGKHIAFSELKLNSGEGVNVYTLPSQVWKNDKNRLQIIDFSSNKLVVDKWFIFIPAFSYEFDSAYYFTDVEVQNCCLEYSIDGEEYEIANDDSDEYLSVEYGNGELLFDIPRVKLQDLQGNEWKNREYFVNEIDRGLYLKLETISGVEGKLYIGNVEIQKDMMGLYTFGNTVYSLMDPKTEGIKLMLTDASGETRTEELGKVIFKEQFVSKPKIEYSDGKLLWDGGYGFIGDMEKETYIRITSEMGDIVHEGTVDFEATILVDNFNVEDGEYHYSIYRENGDLFSLEEDELANGILVCGNYDKIRFNNCRIVIPQIVFDNAVSSGVIDILPAYVDDIRYDEELSKEESSEGICPTYFGTMYFINPDGKRHDYAFEDEKRSETDIRLKTNPVKIVFINESVLLITDEDDDALMYRFYYDRDTHEKKYHITDHQQSSFDRGNYDSVDLLRYRKERIE